MVFNVDFGPGLDSMSPARSWRSASHAAGSPKKLGPGPPESRIRWIQFAQSLLTVAHQPRAGYNKVLCISDTLLLWLVGHSSGKTVLTQLCPRMMRNFNKLVCYYIWKLYYIRTSGIIWTFGFKFYSDYHLNSIYIYYCCFWLVVFCYVLLCISLCVYCKFMYIRMY